MNSARKQRRKQLLVLDEPHEPTTNGTVDQSDLRAAIALLPERQRLALFLRYFADLDYEAIAETLEVAPGTVGATLHAAHSALRARMEVQHR